jgi:hypothetical protein
MLLPRERQQREPAAPVLPEYFSFLFARAVSLGRDGLSGLIFDPAILPDPPRPA